MMDYSAYRDARREFDQMLKDRNAANLFHPAMDEINSIARTLLVKTLLLGVILGVALGASLVGFVWAVISACR